MWFFLALALAEPSHYVHASALNLRATPEGRRVGQLDINTPVEVVSSQGAHSEVIVGNGTRGWVQTQFLQSNPLTFDAAIRSARGAQDAETRLGWAQRAVALEPRHREALAVLRDAYRALGKDGLAGRIERQLAWPDDLRLTGDRPATDGVLRLEFSVRGTSSPSDYRSLTDAEMRGLGVDKGDLVWVLPRQGAAMQVPVMGMTQHDVNECAGTQGISLLVALDLGQDRPLAWTLAETPPASWRSTAPVIDTGPAVALVGQQPGVQSLRAPTFRATAMEGGVYVQVLSLLSEDGIEKFWAHQEWAVRAGRAELLLAHPDDFSYGTPQGPVTARDITGDGTLDLVKASGCGNHVYDQSAAFLRASASLCCGC